MVRTDARPAVFLIGVVTISYAVGSAFSLAVQPPNVLQSDLTTCACYQEDAYPSACPLSTPQLDELCSDIAGYQYNETQTEQFCSASCLDALTSCYRLHAANCSAPVLDYYRTSFCSRNEEGQLCVSVGFGALETASNIVASCSDADGFCPLPSEACTSRDLCSVVLGTLVRVFGCCAPSLLEHDLSPFANFSIGNTYAYTTCGVELGDKCMTPSTVRPSSTLSSSPLNASPSPLNASPSPLNASPSVLPFTAITMVLSVVCILYNL